MVEDRLSHWRLLMAWADMNDLIYVFNVRFCVCVGLVLKVYCIGGQSLLQLGRSVLGGCIDGWTKDPLLRPLPVTT